MWLCTIFHYLYVVKLCKWKKTAVCETAKSSLGLKFLMLKILKFYLFLHFLSFLFQCFYFLFFSPLFFLVLLFATLRCWYINIFINFLSPKKFSTSCFLCSIIIQFKINWNRIRKKKNCFIYYFEITVNEWWLIIISPFPLKILDYFSLLIQYF